MKKITTLIAATVLVANLYANTGIVNPCTPVKVSADKFSPSFVGSNISKDFSIMPNADASQAYIKFTTQKSGIAFVKIYDQNGNLALAQVAVKEAGKNAIVINDFNKVNDGTYSVKIEVNKTTFNRQFVIWK